MEINFKDIDFKKIVAVIIFSSKWLLIPFYLMLFVTLGKLMYHFFIEGGLSNEDLLLTLESVDVVMIANLVKMIITGSYSSFVDKKHGIEENQVSSGILKIKIASSIVGVASIHLLQTFINSENISMETIEKQVIIFSAFVLSCLILASVEYLHVKSGH